jgi:hypothetical protein
VEHLNRLHAIQILRRVRPNIQLNDIRIFLRKQPGVPAVTRMRPIRR